VYVSQIAADGRKELAFDTGHAEKKSKRSVCVAYNAEGKSFPAEISSIIRVPQQPNSSSASAANMSSPSSGAASAASSGGGGGSNSNASNNSGSNNSGGASGGGTFVDRIDPFAKRSMKKKQKKSQGSSRYRTGGDVELQALPLLKGEGNLTA